MSIGRGRFNGQAGREGELRLIQTNPHKKGRGALDPSGLNERGASQTQSAPDDLRSFEQTSPYDALYLSLTEVSDSNLPASRALYQHDMIDAGQSADSILSSITSVHLETADSSAQTQFK